MNPPCHACNAACCRKSEAWTFACVLSEADLKNDRLKSAARWHGALEVLPYKDGKCVFLDGEKNLCRIYDERPEACRLFDCTQCVPDMGFLRHNPKVQALIEHERRSKRNRPRAG